MPKVTKDLSFFGVDDNIKVEGIETGCKIGSQILFSENGGFARWHLYHVTCVDSMPVPMGR